jgi:enterochelin esterase family protein
MRLILLIPAALAALAQTPPALVSPQVHADNRVTFRLFAPKASDARFFGDWMVPGATEAMTKDAAGVWSVTLALKQGMYIYHFVVDGMTIADPVNPRMKLRSRTSASLVEVPGTEPALWQARDVPHGAVEINWVKSPVLNGETRWIWVYTPPGYEQESRRRYPVLYLLHGSNDIAGGWTLAGNANFILDNLLAAKNAVAMIVVMPYGHAVPYGSPREIQAKNTALFENYLLNDVMPFVEAKYRVERGRSHRAIAGLSMGGGQSLHIGFGHPDLFNAVGAFSAAVPADVESRLGKADFKTLWIGCGRQDSLFERSQKLSGLLESRGIRHIFRATEGNHTYTVWRQYLSELVPLLFR